MSWFEHKFKHGFKDTVNPIGICGGAIKSINHFFLHCPEFSEARQTLFYNIQNTDKTLLSLHCLAYFFTVTLNTTPVFMHSPSTREINSCHPKEDSMDLYLTKLKLFFLFYNSFFVWLQKVLLILFCNLLFLLAIITELCSILTSVSSSRSQNWLTNFS